MTLVFGGWLIAHRQMEPADLAMYALYIGIFISPIQILVELTEMMQKGLSGFRRFLDVVETEPEIVDAPDAKPIETMQRTCMIMKRYLFITVMMKPWYFPMFPLKSRQANPLLW